MRVLLTVVCLLSCAWADDFKASLDQKLERISTAAKGTVTVYTTKGMGSGWVVANDPKAQLALIVTCAHVIHGMNDLKSIQVVSTMSQQPALAFIDYEDEDNDIAVIVAVGLTSGVVNVSKVDAKLYEQLFVVASPLGLPHSVSEGFLADMAETMDEAKYYWRLTGAFTTYGASGGAVFDYNGNVQGMVAAVALCSENSKSSHCVPQVGFIIPRAKLAKVLRRYGL